MSMVSIWETSSSAATGMPPGVKFAPTDRELFGYYLYNHIHRTLPPDCYSAIRHHDLYGEDEPWEIWERLQSGSEPGDVYAFAELKKKVKSGGGKFRNSVRKVGKSGGSWHCEYTATKFTLVRRSRSPLEKDERWIGMQRRFSYRNPNPNFAGESSKWILHEFSLKKEGCREEEKEVLCMIRNHGSPSGDLIVEAARRSVLAGRKRKLDDYIRHFASDGASNCSKRVCCSNPATPQLQRQQQQHQQTPLPSAVVECPNPQPVEEDDSETLDAILSIDFDWDNNFDWEDQGCSTTGAADPQSVLDFPQGSSSDQDDKDYETNTSSTAETTQDKSNEPLYLLPPLPPTADCSKPAAANPVVEEDDEGKETMVAAAAAAEDVAPVVVAVDDGTSEGGGGKGKQIVVAADNDDNDDGRQAAKEWMGLLPCDVTAGSMGFSDLLDMPLWFDDSVYRLEGNCVSWEATPYVEDLWGFGSIC